MKHCPRPPEQADLLRPRLVDMIDGRHELVRLAALIDWSWFEQEWAGFFPAGEGRPHRVRVPCFSISHSPGPHSFNPVLSTIRCTGRVPGRGRGMASVSARRLRVAWSGTGRSSPSRARTEPINPSIWRSASRSSARSVSAVLIASSEYRA